MKKQFKLWIYHPSLKAKVIMSEQTQTYLDNGWAESPAEFAKIADFGADATNKEQVQALGETIQGVKDRLNGQLNISTMNKKQLESYAREHFSVELDRRYGLKVLRKEVNELLGV